MRRYEGFGLCGSVSLTGVVVRLSWTALSADLTGQIRVDSRCSADSRTAAKALFRFSRSLAGLSRASLAYANTHSWSPVQGPFVQQGPLLRAVIQ
ncbi:hypothetical protein BCV70DRAFT_199031 [Testicularia cyperi]|uniref:Uncharacterized protein n=1 Tax=Testicularia cyperi TaxID=1882483 RepID=A0A317XUL5_9BASI|nr:hypothetical protein BCV70DRAFT_199031 [Testicularia cyperi]